jgi:hypothetical protein
MVRAGVLQNDERRVKLRARGAEKRGGGFPAHMAFEDRLRRAADGDEARRVSHAYRIATDCYIGVRKRLSVEYTRRSTLGACKYF